MVMNQLSRAVHVTAAHGCSSWREFMPMTEPRSSWTCKADANEPRAFFSGVIPISRVSPSDLSLCVLMQLLHARLFALFLFGRVTASVVVSCSGLCRPCNSCIANYASIFLRDASPLPDALSSSCIVLRRLLAACRFRFV